jgi:hypothetical protein
MYYSITESESSVELSPLDCSESNISRGETMPAVVVPVDLLVEAQVLTSDVDRTIAEVQQADKQAEIIQKVEEAMTNAANPLSAPAVAAAAAAAAATTVNLKNGMRTL